jgi:hypothetical protein
MCELIGINRNGVFMNIEFHYYITYLLAKRAGFSDTDSYLLAYSCQHTDDNSYAFTIKGEDYEYRNYVSQTMDIMKPRFDLMRIYFCFHFVPGDYDSRTVYRKDGKLHYLNTTPDSAHVNAIFGEALHTGNIFRIGIAAHSYADSWAHQNFVGIYDHFNGYYATYDKEIDIIPNIGHATAFTNPDHVGLIWEDHRLLDSQKIDNRLRFLDAAEHLYTHLRRYNKNDITDYNLKMEWENLKKDLETAIGPAQEGKDDNQKNRIAIYKKLIGSGFIDYDHNAWLDAAVDRKVRGLKDNTKGIIIRFFDKPIICDRYHAKKGSDFFRSNWYKFQQAVKEHQDFALDHFKTDLDGKLDLSGLFKKYSLAGKGRARFLKL